MEYLCTPLDKTDLVKTVCTQKGSGSWSMNPEDLIAYNTLGAELEIMPCDMVRVSQKHTANVKIVTRKNTGEGVTKASTFGECDGIITQEKNILLCTVEADCVPVFMLDPIEKVIAMLHSGWKGTAAKISQNAIKLMADNFGTKTENILVCIGPHICAECYEVGEELIAEFETFSKEIFTPKQNGKYLLNLTAAIIETLISCGVKRDNISDMDICTFHTQLFPSYRRDKDKKARMLTGIMLK